MSWGLFPLGVESDVLRKFNREQMIDLQQIEREVGASDYHNEESPITHDYLCVRGKTPSKNYRNETIF